MQAKQDELNDVGVIVGRFQVPDLHNGHIDLIQTVCDNHDKVIIFLGLSPLMVTPENPLDFEARKQMLLEAFPHVNVLYVEDLPSDEAWSKKLDNQVERLTTPRQSVVFYGSRDSFIERYTGKHATQELIQETYYSGTAIRKDVARKSVKASYEFRAGVIWAASSQFPTCYPTVDVAVFNEDGKLLLARKEFETQYRLIGGFASPDSDSYEADARREVQEEAHISITDPVYVGSFKIDDWRYRGEPDRKIKTLLFIAQHFSGRPVPDDDIVEVKWFNVADISLDDIVPSHREMIGVIRKTHLDLGAVEVGYDAK